MTKYNYYGPRVRLDCQLVKRREVAGSSFTHALPSTALGNSRTCAYITEQCNLVVVEAR